MLCPICNYELEKNNYDYLLYCVVCQKEFNKAEVINND